ncbi:MAG TPA: hypothetical protein VIL09_01975 [Microvirga sp.]|jgi:hypothetical protein
MLLPLLRLLAALIPLALPAPSQAGTAEARAWLSRQGYAGPTAGQIVVCHGYGCNRRALLATDAPWLARAASLLAGARGSAEAERRALGEVVRLYTASLAAQLGGRRDMPRSPPGQSGVHGQMDCLDVTANVTSLLVVLEERRLLSHHRVEGPQSRGFFIDGRWPHFTAVVADGSGARYAIDPWTRSPGERPLIAPLSQWEVAAN